MGYFHNKETEHTIHVTDSSSGESVVMEIPTCTPFIMSLDEAEGLATELLYTIDKARIRRDLREDVDVMNRLLNAVASVPNAPSFDASRTSLRQDIELYTSAAGWSCKHDDLEREIDKRLFGTKAQRAETENPVSALAASQPYLSDPVSSDPRYRMECRKGTNSGYFVVVTDTTTGEHVYETLLYQEKSLAITRAVEWILDPE